ncbi:unnamed protein product [Thlaspi arvense]|uniref:Uncharacterized protein n=1 Tax=Thlaspi arvense TaxID=13288 RepID=A0AAU9RMG0_THLAR|nr:unnamed protein product [Thlaspi arvense]
MSNKRSLKRVLILDDDDEEEDKFYRLKVLLPNSTSVTLTLTNKEPEMTLKSFVDLVREEYEKTRKNCEFSGKKKKQVDWNLAAKSFLEFNGEKMKGTVRFETFKHDLCNIIRLDDGSGEDSMMYENMWDLTPDTELLKELPENYSFDTALADLIDNSLQAVWSCSPNDRRLISVDILIDRISLFDSGPGMDSSEENSLARWGKIGASIHRSHKSKAIGGTPPYLMPFFGMFGYGGAFACMHLGRRTLVSSKTKQSKKVFTLQLNKEDLIESRSTSGKNWKVDGGMRDPYDEEIKLSPHGSFTKVEIFEPKCKFPGIYPLQCKLKDIYFPYIQYDEISETRRTLRPVEFQVNGEGLTEIVGGEVATTNLNSKGEEFWFQIRFTEKSKGTSQEANARLKFVYFPIVQGKESTDTIMESLENKGYRVSDEISQTFSRVSVRRLGRLLPEVPWASIPFMERGARATTLQRCCQRVKCFVDLDAGFNPTPSKTDLASQNIFSVALKSFGSRSKEKHNDVSIEIHKEGERLRIGEVEQSYQEWVLKMHKSYDEENASGADEAIVVFESLDHKALCISPDCEAVRVHKVVKRKGITWERGQKIKILKGAYKLTHKNNVYATIDYFLIENFQDEAGGDARIICRQINISEDEGCMLSTINGMRLEIRSSSSFPISIIDSNECVLVDENEWNKKLEQQKEKDPSRIDVLDERDCRALKFDGESTIGDSVCAGQTPPQQIVAVVRPASFSSSKQLKKFDQKQIVKMDGAMLLEVELTKDKNMKSREKNTQPMYSVRSLPTSRGGFHGLYIFPLESKFPNMFKKAGTYNLCFSVGNSITYRKKLVVEPSSKVGCWKLASNLETINVRVGSLLPPCSIACFDEYENPIPFTCVPSLEVKLRASPGFELRVDEVEANLIARGVLQVKNMLVEADWLDHIRPDYKATLEIYSKDEPFSLSVACKMKPGPLKSVVESNPQAFENLLPDSFVEIFILQMMDGYNNHVAEGTNVLISIDGFCIQDSMSSNRKVDGNGCIDLSGILKVTAGYGKYVSLSVMHDNEEIFKKVSLIEKRDLVLLTELPEYCEAGSNLTNLIFKVTEPDGSLDTNIHHDEKSGSFHTMTIESDSSTFESGIRYAFVHGCCKVVSLSLPETEGVFSFKAFHSRFPDIHMSFKIQLTSAQTSERDEIGCSDPFPRMCETPQSKMGSTTNQWVTPTQKTPCSEFGVLSSRELSSALSSQTVPLDMAQYADMLKAKLNSYSERRVEIDECLKRLEAEQQQAEQVLSTLQDSLEHLGAAFPECLSTKESMMKHIEEKHHETAAAVFCCMYRNAPTPKSFILATKGYHRVLSEYLGEDTMLALVCKSSRLGSNSSEYLRLQSEAVKLGRSITKRFHVLCLDAARPWTDKFMEIDPQMKLAMDDPKLPDGDPIPGFKGYAVNMIELAPEELFLKTYDGRGLRETLFYGLFGKLQVYETQRHVEEALPHLSGYGAVSLDGFIAKGNGFIYSGCSKPEIHFPITVREDEDEKLREREAARDRVKMVVRKIEEERCSLLKLEKKMNKTKERYDKCNKTFF